MAGTRETRRARRGTPNKKHQRVGVYNKSDVPPDFDIRRETPRSLSQTLRMIRTKGNKSPIEKMAKRLNVGESILRRWERPPELEVEISLRNIQRYQDLIGVPSSIIQSISQILAAARDNRPELLEVLAIMLGKLAQRIGTARDRTAAIDLVLGTGKKRRRPEDTLYSDWDNLLDLLIGEVFWAPELNTIITSGPAKGKPLREAFVYQARLRLPMTGRMPQGKRAIAKDAGDGRSSSS